MKFFQRLFKRTNDSVDCPRCLGKGHVDIDDIKRLGNELRWNPGKCAYCNGAGKVEPELISKVAVSEPYLTNNLPNAERNRVINRDKAAVERAKLRKVNSDLVIQQIKELYFVKNLDVEQIAEFYLQSTPEWDIQQKNAMVEYISRVIAYSTKEN